MVRHVASFALILAAGLHLGAGSSRAEPKALVLASPFKGSVANEKLGSLAPANGVVSNQMKLDTIWEMWKIADKKPTVNFDKEVVILQTTRGSRLLLNVTLDTATGNLLIGGLSTADFGEGFRYAGGVVSREGIKSVAGKEFPKD